MKYYILGLTFMVLSTLCIGQTAAKISTMKIEQSVWDFGTFKELGGPVFHTFEFTNTGKTPFVIENISVSCGCTTPEYSKAPVMPGRKGSIKITFDPTNRPGHFIKEIYVTSNNRANQNTIKIKGNVEPRPRTIEDDYPVLMSNGFRIASQIVAFGYIGQGDTRSMTIPYINNSAKIINLAVDVEPSNPYFKISAPSSICAGCKGEITVTYDLSKVEAWGMFSENIHLSIDGKSSNAPISVTGIGVDSFKNANAKVAPKFLISSQFYHFGDVKKGSKLSQEFTISNEGEAPLIIRHIEARSGAAISLTKGTEIAPHKSITVTVTLSPVEAELGRVFGHIVIIANDPQRPMREIRLVANII